MRSGHSFELLSLINSKISSASPEIHPIITYILNAIYGLKTFSHEYQHTVPQRIAHLNFIRLHICSSIFNKYEDRKHCLVYAYVDDFIFGGNDELHTLSQTAAFRALAYTTEPGKNYFSLLGMEIERDKDRRLIKVTMAKRIQELADTFPQSKSHHRTVPIPTSGYLVSDADFDQLAPRHPQRIPIQIRPTSIHAAGRLPRLDPRRPS